METFGQKVRQAVESQGLPLDKVAQATGLAVEHIEALERGEFAALPGDEIVREALRSFARLVNVDPDEVIADYGRERQRWMSAEPAQLEIIEIHDNHDDLTLIEAPPPAHTPPVVQPATQETTRRGGFGFVVWIGLGIAVAGFLLLTRQPEPPGPGLRVISQTTAPSRAAAQEARAVPVSPEGTAHTPLEVPSRPQVRTKPAPAIEQPSDSAGLSIREHGVGMRVVRHELAGEAEQFAEGERVFFWTRIEGGAAGESIDHVWIYEGKEMLRVPLKVGGARWRTHSYKDLNPGSVGTWAVEARDSAGWILARREFVCSASLE